MGCYMKKTFVLLLISAITAVANAAPADVRSNQRAQHDDEHRTAATQGDNSWTVANEGWYRRRDPYVPAATIAARQTERQSGAWQTN